MSKLIEVFTRSDCVFCTNLKIIINKLVNNDILKCEIKYITASANESVPYILKHSDNKPVQKLIGLPTKEKLFRFLEINTNESEISNVFPDSARKKNRKVFQVD